MHSRKYSWKHVDFWCGLGVYALFAIASTRVAGPDARGFIRLLMLVMLVICMVTERGRWDLWQRVFFVPVMWVTGMVLAALLAFTVGPFMSVQGVGPWIDNTVVGISNIPVIILGMRQSKLFVREVQGPDRAHERTS